MSLESGTYVSDLVATNPTSTDYRRQGDDHLRLLKGVLRTTFPNASKAFRFSEAEVKTTNYSVVADDQNKIIGLDATSAAFTLTLPTLTSDDDGWGIWIIKVDETVNEVTFSGTVNGLASRKLVNPFDATYLMWTGSSWYMRPLRQGLRAVSLSADTTLSLDHLNSVVSVDTTSEDIAVTLPDVVKSKGASISMVKTAGSNDTTFVGTINGDTNLTLTELYSMVTVFSNGSTWLVTSLIGGVANGAALLAQLLGLPKGIDTATAKQIFVADGSDSGAWVNLDYTHVPAGMIIGVAYDQTLTPQTYAVAIPVDDTKPQISEGVQILTVDYTPKSSTSLLRIDAQVNMAENSNTTNNLLLALFKNGESDAIAATVTGTFGSITGSPTGLTYFMVAGVTTEITFALHAGSDNGGSFNINKGYADDTYGEILVSTLVVTEIKQ